MENEGDSYPSVAAKYSAMAFARIVPLHDIWGGLSRNGLEMGKKINTIVYHN